MFKNLIIFGLLASQISFGAGVTESHPTDLFMIGKGSSTGTNKNLIYNLGLGAGNPSLFVDPTAKGLNYSQNIFSLGDGTNSNKTIYANTGATNKPAIVFNTTNSTWQYSNDGSTFNTIGSGTITARYFGPTAPFSTGTFVLASFQQATNDATNIYNISTGTATIAVAGGYQVNAHVSIVGNYGPGNANGIAIYHNGSMLTSAYTFVETTVTQIGIDVGVSDTIQCAVGDTIQIYVNNGGSSPSFLNDGTRSYFSISKF